MTINQNLYGFPQGVYPVAALRQFFPPTTPFVVGPSGNFSTIQDGINAANKAGGGMVFIQKGSYAENLVFPSNIQIFGDSEQGTFITGTHTPPASGTLNINRVTFISTTHIFSSLEAGTCVIILEDSTVTVTNGYTFNLPNWTSPGQIQCFNIGPGGTNDGFINNTGGANVAIFAAGVGNGSSNPMILSGATFFGPAITISCPVNCGSGTNILSTNNQYFGTFTFSGNSTAAFYNDSFVSGASPAITQSSNGTLSFYNCVLNSSNNPSFTGAGAGVVTLCNVSFASNDSISGTLSLATNNAIFAGEVRANGDAGGMAATTSLTAINSTTISSGDGSIKMSTANPGTNSAWIKIYIGTTAYWVPAWLTNAP